MRFVGSVFVWIGGLMMISACLIYMVIIPKCRYISLLCHRINFFYFLLTIYLLWSKQTPSTPGSTRRVLLGSIERSLNKVRYAFTPKKSVPSEITTSQPVFLTTKVSYYSVWDVIMMYGSIKLRHVLYFIFVSFNYRELTVNKYTAPQN